MAHVHKSVMRGVFAQRYAVVVARCFDVSNVGACIEKRRAVAGRWAVARSAVCRTARGGCPLQRASGTLCVPYMLPRSSAVSWHVAHGRATCLLRQHDMVLLCYARQQEFASFKRQSLRPAQRQCALFVISGCAIMRVLVGMREKPAEALAVCAGTGVGDGGALVVVKEVWRGGAR